MKPIRIVLTHGHQADFMNYIGWKINRFMVREYMETTTNMGISDPKVLLKIMERIKIELQ
jgi:hypothetical protein